MRVTILVACLLVLVACGNKKDKDERAKSKPVVVPTEQTFNFMSDDPILKTIDVNAPNADRDHDRLSDVDEATKYHTNPNDPDTDRDGLLDGWEVYGVNGIDLAKLGASPLHRDVFVEMDYMTRDDASNGLGPSDDVLKRIVEIFDSAPVDNPDGKPGIRLHLEIDSEVPYDEDLSPLNEEFYSLRKENFKSEIRGPVYHYMIWANAYENDDSSGYSMNIPGSDFIVTLGRWHKNAGGTDDEKVGTFVHELGHNLGLHHGSVDDTNRKPNHLSVMNYNFQTSGVMTKAGRVWGLQAFAMKSLDENALVEADGLQPKFTELGDYETMWKVLSGATRTGAAGGPLDWTGDKKISNSKVAVDLNDDHQKGLLGATINEWAALKYKIGTIGSVEKRFKLHELAEKNFVLQPVKELTSEEDRIIKARLNSP